MSNAKQTTTRLADPNITSSDPPNVTPAPIKFVRPQPTISALGAICANVVFNIAPTAVYAKVYPEADATPTEQPPHNAVQGQNITGTTWVWSDILTVPNPLPTADHLLTATFPTSTFVVWYQVSGDPDWQLPYTVQFQGATGGPGNCGSPSITANPANQSVTLPSGASFTAAASSPPTPTARWQVNSGSGWSNLANGGVYSGVTTNTLNISDATGLNGNQYRAVYTITAGSATSPAATTSPATLTVTAASPRTSLGTSIDNSGTLQGTISVSTSLASGDLVLVTINAGNVSVSPGGTFVLQWTPTGGSAHNFTFINNGNDGAGNFTASMFYLSITSGMTGTGTITLTASGSGANYTLMEAIQVTGLSNTLVANSQVSAGTGRPTISFSGFYTGTIYAEATFAMTGTGSAPTITWDASAGWASGNQDDIDGTSSPTASLTEGWVGESYSAGATLTADLTSPASPANWAAVIAMFH